MKDLLKLTAATAALALGMSGANAAFLVKEDANGNKIVVNTETEQEHHVLEGSGTQQLAECPDGAFLLDPEASDDDYDVVTDCTTDSVYRMGPIDDTYRAAGYPDGTFLLSPEDDQPQNTEVITEQEAERRAAPMGQQQ